MNNLSMEDLYGRSNNDIVVELGKRFRDYRIALRLTQKDIAEQTGLSVMTIARLRKAKGQPSDLTILWHLPEQLSVLKG